MKGKKGRQGGREEGMMGGRDDGREEEEIKRGREKGGSHTIHSMR